MIGWSVAARMLAGALAGAMAVAVMIGPAEAVNPDEILSDPAQEERARGISAGLRCLVCQNQSIDDSDAPLARDLRLLVRERIQAGDSDAAIIDFVVARYGEFVLLEPRLTPKTWALWLAPVMLLLIGGSIIAAVFRRNRRATEVPLDSAEESRLSAVLDGGQE